MYLPNRIKVAGIFLVVILNIYLSCCIRAQKIIPLEPVTPEESDENLLYPLSKIPIKEGFSSSAYSILYDCTTLATHNWHIVSSTSRRWPAYQNFPELPDNHRCALIVFLHGLDGHPSRWEHFLITLEAERKYDLWCPQIPYKGNVPAASATEVLLPDIQGYMRTWPERPVVIIGSSNGARLGLIIETQLRNHHGNKMMLVSIAGLHGATQRIWVRRWVMRTNEQLYDEINFPSKHAIKTIAEARKPLPDKTHRDYIFYAADNDQSVTPLNSCFPVLGHNEKFFYVKHTGHFSIAPAIEDHLLETVNSWLTANISQKNSSKIAQK